MGKVHMALGRAGKVRNQTPIVPLGTPPAPPTGKVVKKVGFKLSAKLDIEESSWASPELLVQMLRREQELRMSPEMQQRYAELDDDLVLLSDETSHQLSCDYDIVDTGLLLDEEIQKQVLDEFGVMWTPWEYRRACEAAPSTIGNECCWLKYDRMCLGLHSVGDPHPNVVLYALDGMPIRLSDVVSSSGPTVVLAGSFS